MANAVTHLRQPSAHLIAILVLMAAMLLAWSRVEDAIKSNRAFVAANQLPSLFAAHGNLDALATAEARFHDLEASGAPPRSAQRMMALIRHARHGADMPSPVASAALTGKELVWWARQKEALGEYGAARYLYEWAAGQDGDFGDAWLLLGQLHRQQQRPQEALRALQRATEATVWQELGRSDAYLALGDLYRSEPAVIDAEAALASYSEALRRDEFAAAENRARTHYGLAEILLWQKDDPASAAEHYAATLVFTPNDHWARLRLGYTHYWADGNVESAEREIMSAIAAWPDEKYLQWPYFYLGEIYEHAGRRAEALQAYEQVLVLDPAHERARQSLVTLRSP